MKNNNLLAMIFLAAITVQCCRPTDKAESMGDTTTAVDHVVVDTDLTPGSNPASDGIQTAMFLEKAALMARLESEWGKLAEEKALNRRLSGFGRGVSREIAAINSPLNAIASARGLKLPVDLPLNEEQRIRDMRRMENDHFEKLYLKMVIEDYRKNVELFKGAGNSPDTVVSNFARRFLPVLEKHLGQALDLKEKKNI